MRNMYKVQSRFYQFKTLLCLLWWPMWPGLGGARAMSHQMKLIMIENTAAIQNLTAAINMYTELMQIRTRRGL